MRAVRDGFLFQFMGGAWLYLTIHDLDGYNSRLLGPGPRDLHTLREEVPSIHQGFNITYAVVFPESKGELVDAMEKFPSDSTTRNGVHKYRSTGKVR